MPPAGAAGSGPRPKTNSTGSLATFARVQQVCWCKLPTSDQLDEVCLAGPLELQRSAVAGTRSCQNGALPIPPTGHSKCRAKKHIPGPNGIYLAWDLLHSISPLLLCSSVPKKIWQDGEASPQVNWDAQLSDFLNMPTASMITSVKLVNSHWLKDYMHKFTQDLNPKCNYCQNLEYNLHLFTEWQRIDKIWAYYRTHLTKLTGKKTARNNIFSQ